MCSQTGPKEALLALWPPAARHLVRDWPGCAHKSLNPPARVLPGTVGVGPGQDRARRGRERASDRRVVSAKWALPALVTRIAGMRSYPQLAGA